MELDELVKELDKKLVVTRKEIKGWIMYIYCETKKQSTRCKKIFFQCFFNVLDLQ